MLYPPTPSDRSPCREKYALQPIFFFLPDLRYGVKSFEDGVLPCPHCKTSKTVTSNGYTQGRRVVGFKYTYALIGRQYLCKSCQSAGRSHTFRAWHPDVLALLPPHLREEFQITCMHKTCIDNELMHTMNITINEQGTYTGFRRLVAELHAEEFVRRGSQFLHHLAWDSLGRPRKIEAMMQRQNSIPRVSWFADPSTRSGYGDYVPSAEFFQEVHLRFLEVRDEYETRALQHVDGDILAVDTSHKVTKLVYVAATTQVYHGLFTVMNEYGQVVAFWFVKTGTMEEIRPAMRALRRRYVTMGWPLPVAIYSDRALQDNTFLQDVLLRAYHHRDGGRDNAVAPVPSSPDRIADLPWMTLPAQGHVILVGHRRDCEQAVRAVRAELTRTGDDFVGFDCEWDIPLGGGRSPISLIQISTVTGVVALFQLARMNLPRANRTHDDDDEEARNTDPDSRESKKLLPPALRELLEDVNLMKVGNNIRGDFTRLKREYVLQDQGVVDLQSFGKTCRVIQPPASLTRMCEEVLGKALQKDGTVRCSRWSQDQLSSEQIQYAALDAYASAQVYARIWTMCDPIAKPSRPVVPGEIVVLYTASHALAVAHAKVVKLQGSDRADVRILKVLVGGVLLLHPKAGKMETLHEAVRGVEAHNEPPLVLWDIEHLRPKPTVMTPAPPLGTVHESAAEELEHHDDDVLANEAYDRDSQRVHDSSDLCFSHFITADAIDAQPHVVEIDDDLRQLLGAPPLRTKSDVFHVLNGIGRTLKKSHGAFNQFMLRLRDCLLRPIADDLEYEEQLLRLQGKSPEQIEKLKQYGWQYLLDRVRRSSICDRSKLLADFDSVCKTFENIRDAHTQKTLFTQDTQRKVKQIRRCIAAGTLTDPDMAMYHQIGEDAFHRPVYRCFRGTSALEGFHRTIRDLLQQHVASPRLAYNILRHHIFRWNTRMAKHRGIEPPIAEFYRTDVLDAWQLLTAKWWPEPIFKGRLNVFHTADTGERFGILQQGDSSQLDFFPSSDQDGDVTIPQTSAIQWLSSREGVAICTLPVSTQDEKAKFYAEAATYRRASRRDAESEEGDLHGAIDYERWSHEWNNFVGRMERGLEEMKNVTRKNAAMLKSFHHRELTEINRQTTMQSLRWQNVQLVHRLHVPVAVGLQHSTSTLIQEATQTPTWGEQGNGQVLATVPLTTTFEVVRMDNAEPPTTCTETSQKRPINQAEHGNRHKRKRNPPMCRVCGHARYLGRYGAASFHDRTAPASNPAFCTVPQTEWVTKNARRKGWCDCTGCGLRQYGFEPS